LLRFDNFLYAVAVSALALVGVGGSASAHAQADAAVAAPAPLSRAVAMTGLGAQNVVAAASVRRSASRTPVRRTAARAGQRGTAQDQLGLKSTVALVVDQETSQVLFSKNSEAVLPIASLTKLMTALVVVESKLPLDEMLEVTAEDTNIEWRSRSRLRLGTRLTREDMLHLALMSSENRAAQVLGRNYPGGLPAFVDAMNRKAQQLGMADTRYVEPTGLSSDNRSSAHDLATLARAIYEYPLLRDLSISTRYEVPIGRHQVQFRNTNALVSNPTWDIGLQKTGYIAAAGRCLMMQASLAGRKLIMVFLDSAGKYTRIGDAQRVRRWLESQPMAAAVAVPAVQQLQPSLQPAAVEPAVPADMEDDMGGDAEDAEDLVLPPQPQPVS
jgi:D-alanyl-D-alanine endopeptidase (penicillin-binding protein 7)